MAPYFMVQQYMAQKIKCLGLYNMVLHKDATMRPENGNMCHIAFHYLVPVDQIRGGSSIGYHPCAVKRSRRHISLGGEPTNR